MRSRRGRSSSPSCASDGLDSTIWCAVWAAGSFEVFPACWPALRDAVKLSIMRCTHFCPQRCLTFLRDFFGDSQPRSRISPPNSSATNQKLVDSTLSAPHISQLIACRIILSPLECFRTAQCLHRQRCGQEEGRFWRASAALEGANAFLGYEVL